MDNADAVIERLISAARHAQIRSARNYKLGWDLTIDVVVTPDAAVIRGCGSVNGEKIVSRIKMFWSEISGAESAAVMINTIANMDESMGKALLLRRQQLAEKAAAPTSANLTGTT